VFGEREVLQPFWNSLLLCSCDNSKSATQFIKLVFRCSKYVFASEDDSSNALIYNAVALNDAKKTFAVKPTKFSVETSDNLFAFLRFSSVKLIAC